MKDIGSALAWRKCTPPVLKMGLLSRNNDFSLKGRGGECVAGGSFVILSGASQACPFALSTFDMLSLTLYLSKRR